MTNCTGSLPDWLPKGPGITRSQQRKEKKKTIGQQEVCYETGR